MGSAAGMFDINNVEKFFSYIKRNYNHSEYKYCFVEKRTEYYKLFFDLDMKDDIIKKIIENNENFKINKFWNYIIKNIDEVLKYYINDFNFEYIYSFRADNEYKLHLYYPKIIVNSSIALTIRDKLIKNLMADDMNCIDKLIYEKIFDDHVYKANGFRLLYQKKIG